MTIYRKAGSRKTVTLEHLATKLSEVHAFPKKQAEVMLNNLFSQVAEHLKDGRGVQLGKLGSLEVNIVSPARIGPVQFSASGAPTAIKEISFSASKGLKRGLDVGRGTRGAAETVGKLRARDLMKDRSGGGGDEHFDKIIKSRGGGDWHVDRSRKGSK